MATETLAPPYGHPVLHRLAQLARSHDPAEAVSEIRQLTRCTPEQARQLVHVLAEGRNPLHSHPDLTAILIGDPQPSLLARFRQHRPMLLRLIRRSRRLEVMRWLQEQGVNSSQSRLFLQALVMQGEHWLLLEQLYADPSADFWTLRPTPDPPPNFEESILSAPENFDPQLFLNWLAKGHDRACVLWVRRLSGAERERCQALVDRLDELVYDNHPDPWQCATEEYPDLVAALAGRANPLWLQQLDTDRDTLLGLINGRRSLAAIALVNERLGCDSRQSRRFLRSLSDSDSWDQTLRDYARRQLLPEPPPPPPPPPVVEVEPVAEIVPEIAPVELTGAATEDDTPVLAGAPPEPKAEVEIEVKAEAPPVEAPKEFTTAAPRRAVPWQTPEVEPAPPKLSLDDPEALLAHLGLLAQACKEQDWEASTRLFGELETAGFNRAWMAARYPQLVPWLPEEPWNQQIPQLGALAEKLQKLSRGELAPQQLLQDSLRAANLDKLVEACEKAWKTKSKQDVLAASALMAEHPELNEDLNKRLPWLTKLTDLDHDGTSDLVELATDPGDYFMDLLRQRYPDLEQRLGNERMARLREVLPELVEATRERNMRSLMRTMSKLRLGPADVKTVIVIIKALLKR